MIETFGLHVASPAQCLIRDLNWHVQAGECWLVLGRNGAGKSTLLQTLLGLQSPQSGQIHLNGIPLTQHALEHRARLCAYLAQGRHDAFSYRVLDAVLAARHPYQLGYWESETDHTQAQHALQQLDLAHLAQRDIRTLSGGERQRVAIAALMVQDTPFLFLDEPNTGLDLAHQVALSALLKQQYQTQGKAIVLVSHDLNLGIQLASHVLLLLPEGAWHACPVAEVPLALLGACLGHPLERVRHGQQTFFIPSMRSL